MAVVEAIATTYLEADAASVTFSSLGSYEHLQLRYSTRSAYDTTNNYDSIYLRFATGGGSIDTGTNYSIHQMYASQTTAAANSATGQTGIYVAGMADTPASVAAEYGPTVLDILDYRNGSKNTTIQTTFSTGAKGTATAYLIFASGLWDNVGAVDQIQLSTYSTSNFVRGSEFTLYGLNSS